jgi:hypothetical protein
VLYESIPGFHQHFSIKDNGQNLKIYQKKSISVFQTSEARDKKESTGDWTVQLS